MARYTLRRDETESGELYRFLYENFPEFRHPSKDDLLNVPYMRVYFGVCSQAIYAWFKKGVLPHKRAMQCCQSEGAKVAMEDMVDFLPE